MAIIYSYPIAIPQGSDLLIISRTPTDPDETSNYSVTITSVADHIIDRLIDPDATDFKIPVFNQGGTRITGSIMSQDSSPSNGVAGTKLTIAGDLTVSGTGFFTDQVTIPATPVAATDAASKSYVDASNLNQVTGGGEPNKIPKWTGAGSPSNVLGDSIISELANEITIAGDLKVGQNNTTPGLYSVAIGEDNSVLGNQAIGIGFNNTVSGNRCGGLGANNTVAGGQVWATGDGNNVGIDLLGVGGNIITSGFNNNVKSGNSCVVGTGNTLTNTTQSAGINTNFVLGSSNTLNDVTDGIAIGFNNTINNDDSCIFGKNNTTSATDTYAVGKGNTLTSINDYAFGLNNSISGNGVIAMAIGQANVLSGKQSYAFGRELVDGGEDDTVILGRFNAAPTATGRIVFGTGFNNTTGRKNAIEIQAGDGAQSGLLFPALRLSASYNSNAEATAGGVENGELYRSNNQVRINTNQIQQDARNNEGFVFLTPKVKIISSGESFDYDTNYNLLKLEWSGAGTSAGVVLPTAASSQNRVLQCVTDSSLSGKDINITVSGGGTINAGTSITITGAYQSIKFWSDGTGWYILNQQT